VLSLFAGIGGFDLGLARAGMQTVAFCEIDPFACRVLAKHWPEVPIYEDIRTLTADWLAEMGLWPDVICGGFPCQDISFAGKGAGIGGERSGLWREYARLIGEIRPRYVIVENVSALLGRGLGDVLGDLAALGYDAEWHCIPASAVGGFQRRDRAWIIAYGPLESGKKILYQDAIYDFRNCAGLYDKSRKASHFDDKNSGQGAVSLLGHGFWPKIPDRERSGTDGRLSDGLDRYRSIGNAVVPQIPELIGRSIMRITP